MEREVKNERKQSAHVSPPAFDKTSQGGHAGPESRSTQELVRDTMYSHVRHKDMVTFLKHLNF